MAIPTAERPPKGLNAYWLGAWRHALKTLKDQGTWAWELRPLLDEYVYALRAAEATRDGFAWLERLENLDPLEVEGIDWQVLERMASALPTQWDRHTKRAAALADQLALTPRGRKAVDLGDPDETARPKADPLAGVDELATKRGKRTA